MDGEREKFEAWATSQNYYVSRQGDGYLTETQYAYEGWQARASLPDAQPSDVVEEHKREMANRIRNFLVTWFTPKDFQNEGIECNPLAWELAEMLLKHYPTTQQAQSGDVGKLVEACRDYIGAMKWWHVDEYDRQRPQYDDIENALTPFTQNKGSADA